MSLRDSMVSMAWSEKHCCPPLFFDVRGFHDLMTDGDIHKVKEPRLHSDCSYAFQLVTLFFYCTLDYDFVCVTLSYQIPNMLFYLCSKAYTL